MQVSRLSLAASLIAIVWARPATAGEDLGAGQEIYQAQCAAFIAYLHISVAATPSAWTVRGL
jgi:hypothetical protein